MSIFMLFMFDHAVILRQWLSQIGNKVTPMMTGLLLAFSSLCVYTLSCYLNWRFRKELKCHLRHFKAKSKLPFKLMCVSFEFIEKALFHFLI